MSYPYHSDHPNVQDRHEVDSTPEVADVQQEAVAVAGKVEVEGNVRVLHLPSRIGTSRSYTVTDTDTNPLLGSDLRRSRVVILATTTSVGTATGIYIGAREDVRAGVAAFWPVNVALTLQNTEQVYVRCATTSAAALVSVIAENWAD